MNVSTREEGEDKSEAKWNQIVRSHPQIAEIRRTFSSNIFHPALAFVPRQLSVCFNIPQATRQHNWLKWKVLRFSSCSHEHNWKSALTNIWFMLFSGGLFNRRSFSSSSEKFNCWFARELFYIAEHQITFQRTKFYAHAQHSTTQIFRLLIRPEFFS